MLRGIAFPRVMTCSWCPVLETAVDGFMKNICEHYLQTVQYPAPFNPKLDVYDLTLLIYMVSNVDTWLADCHIMGQVAN